MVEPLLRLISLFLITTLLVSCGSALERKYGRDIVGLKYAAASQQSLVFHFHALCITGKGDGATTAKAAENNNWDAANEKDLLKADLSALKKLVLKIPGGGGRISESQLLLMRITEDAGPIIASVEERYYQGRLIMNSCSLYTKQTIFLKVCSEIGSMLKTAPDINRAYKTSGSQFITWNVRIAEKRGTITCQKAPNAKLLPYEGMSLVLKVDQITKLPNSSKNNSVLDK